MYSRQSQELVNLDDAPNHPAFRFCKKPVKRFFNRFWVFQLSISVKFCVLVVHKQRSGNLVMMKGAASYRRKDLSTDRACEGFWPTASQY